MDNDTLSAKQKFEERKAMQFEYKCEKELHAVVNTWREEHDEISKKAAERDNLNLKTMKHLKQEMGDIRKSVDSLEGMMKDMKKLMTGMAKQ